MISSFVGLRGFVSKFLTTTFHFFHLAYLCLFIFNALEEAKAFLWKSWGLLGAQVKKSVVHVISSELKN